MVSQSPQHDLLCPMSFIPFLSESGLEVCDADLELLGLGDERPWTLRRVSIPLTSLLSRTHICTHTKLLFILPDP